MKRRRAVQATTVLAVLGGLTTLGIQVDRWRLERKRMVVQLRFDEQVRDCEETGGRWWRGACIDEPVP